MAGERAYITIKGLSAGISRLEFEYEIPLQDAVEMLETLSLEPIIDKHRSKIAHAGLVWEVDEFHGANEGLVVAEVELTSADEAFDLPPWVGEEVSGDPRYFNANLVANPFMNWKELKSEES
jgi:CYTH domain-containing protein